jgi:hypothetical protein
LLRPTIRDLFYDWDEFVRQAKEAGVELRWIGLGTWVLPNEIIPERHLQAWRITVENLGRGSQAAMDAVLRESRVERLHALVADMPFKVFEGLDTQDPVNGEKNMATLVNAYRAKLYAALEATRARKCRLT